MKNLEILVKFPTKGRPEKFIQTLDQYYRLVDNIQYTKFLICCDVDDPSMNNEGMIQQLKSFNNIKVRFDNNKSKVEAINVGLQKENFDIILLASDDMIPLANGYDRIIRKLMMREFPDLDGVLWFNDGVQGFNLNTLSILGRVYYNRFNYIYHPDYKSLFCDQEFTHVSKKLEKVVYCDTPIIQHRHHSTTYEPIDSVYAENERFYQEDLETFRRRKDNNFV